MRILSLGLAAAALLATTPALAGNPVAQPMTCPIGGKAFTFNTTSSHSSWGARPDGKPYGSWEFPLALPECPDNGLVLFKDYTPAEIAKLEPIVASEAYQALRTEVPYYRAWWLMKQLGVGASDALYVLLQATWQADGKPEQRARYLAAFAEESASLPARPKDLDWIGMEGRAANALRELGRFDEASARLGKVPVAGLKAATPKANDRSAAANAARQRLGWHEYFTELATVIARKDASAEPFEMLPRRAWLGYCIQAKALDAHQSAFCATNSAAVDQARAEKTKFEAEMKRLAEQRDKSGR